jgi:hypothetical protein
MEGYFALISIKLPRSGGGNLVVDASTLDQSSNNLHAYSGVEATFCHIIWSEQESDPAHVPVYTDLQDESILCRDTLYKVDLYTIARQAVDYDSRNYTFAATPPKLGQGPVAPTAVVFHQSKSGSTLVSNVLAAASPAGHVRVYSDPTAPLTALQACHELSVQYPDRVCNQAAHHQLIQDVFYLMGRTTRPNMPQYVYYKLPPVASLFIDVFQLAMPDAPWAFVYREPLEILASHFRNYQLDHPLSQDFMPACLQQYGQHNYIQPSPYLTHVVESQGRTLDSLTKEEYCAAHLASLAESAIAGYRRTMNDRISLFTWFLPYSGLPHLLWESMIPNLQGPVTDNQLQRMQRVSHYYSKGRGPRQGETWKEDGLAKQSMATDSMRAAASVFMEPTYDKLQAVYEAIKMRLHH